MLKPEGEWHGSVFTAALQAAVLSATAVSTVTATSTTTSTAMSNGGRSSGHVRAVTSPLSALVELRVPPQSRSLDAISQSPVQSPTQSPPVLQQPHAGKDGIPPSDPLNAPSGTPATLATNIHNGTPRSAGASTDTAPTHAQDGDVALADFGVSAKGARKRRGNMGIARISTSSSTGALHQQHQLPSASASASNSALYPTVTSAKLPASSSMPSPYSAQPLSAYSLMTPMPTSPSEQFYITSAYSSASGGQQKQIQIVAPNDINRREINATGFSLAEYISRRMVYNTSNQNSTSSAGGDLKTRILDQGFSTDCYINDLLNYLHILNQDLAAYRPHDFTHLSSYEIWKQTELAALVQIIQMASLKLNINPRIYVDSSMNASSPLPNSATPIFERALITLLIHQAENLYVKDKASGSSNPYAVVSTADGCLLQSGVIERSLNPEWKFCVSLVIHDPSDVIYITLWTKVSEGSGRRSSRFGNFKSPGSNTSPDGFLGMVILKGGELIQTLTDQEKNNTGFVEKGVEKWYTLEKRSAKSHVSGKILVSYEKTIKKDQSYQNLYHLAFQCIPRDPYLYYTNTVDVFMKNSISTNLASPNTITGASSGLNKVVMNQALLSNMDLKVLEDICKIWRIDAISKLCIQYTVMIDLYFQKLIHSQSLYESMLLLTMDQIASAYESYMIPKNLWKEFIIVTETKLYVPIKSHLTSFFNSVTLTWSSSSARTFQILLTILEAICVNPHIVGSSISRLLQQKDLDPKSLSKAVVENVEMWIQESFRARLVGIRAMAEMEMKKNSTASVVKEYESAGSGSDGIDEMSMRGEILVFILGRICEDWSSLLAHFDTLYLGKIHIPTIAAKTWLEVIIPELDIFKASFDASPLPDLDVAFRLYEQVRKIEKLSELIDYRLLTQFKIREWFRPFVMGWIRLSETKISEWIMNAIKVDDFELLEVGHSSSVLDIFTSFQQQLDFILKLQWPDERDLQLLISILIENIGEGIEKYVSVISLSIKKDLLNFSSQSTEASQSSQVVKPSTQVARKKFKVKLRKFGPPVDGSELRIPSKALVKLSNLESILTRFNELISHIPPHLVQTSETVPESVSPHIHSEFKPLPFTPNPYDPNSEPPPPTPTSANTLQLPPPLPYRRRSPSLPSTSTSTSTSIPTKPVVTPRTPLYITFESMTCLKPIKPYTTELSFSLSSPHRGSQHLGRTRPYPQSSLSSLSSPPSPVVDIHETIPLLATHSDMGSIAVLLSQHVERDVYVVANAGLNLVHVLSRSGDMGFSGRKVEVSLGGVCVRLEVVVVKDGRIEVVRDRIRYVVQEAIENVKEDIVDKLCHDLRIRLKDMSSGYKKSIVFMSNIKTKTKQFTAKTVQLFNFTSSNTAQSTTTTTTTTSTSLSSSSTLSIASTNTASKSSTSPPQSSLTTPTETDVHIALSPLLEFLNVNLGVVSETLSFVMSRQLVLSLWKRILHVSMHVLVPSLGQTDEEKDKKAWESGRVAFLRFALDIMKSFLHADGEGLSLDSMNVREWKDIQGIFDHYHQTHWKELVVLYQEKLKCIINSRGGEQRRASDASVGSQEVWSERDLDWMLRLIRMRGGKEFVDVVLEERVKKK